LLGNTRVFMPFMSAGNMNRPQAVRDMAEAVLEIAEDAEVHPGFDLRGHHLPELAVHGRPGRCAVWKEERQVRHTQIGDALGEVAAGLISERQHTLLNQPEDVLAAITKIQDVVDVLDLDLTGKLRREPVADLFHRETKAARCGDHSRPSRF
jgi:hypothetical protein